MKFTPDVNEKQAQNEYKMYTYLNAINNKKAEKYGIPTVYYFGKWNLFSDFNKMLIFVIVFQSGIKLLI